MRPTVMGIPLAQVLRSMWTRKMWVGHDSRSGGMWEEDIPKMVPGRRLLSYRAKRKRLNKISAHSRRVNRMRG